MEGVGNSQEVPRTGKLGPQSQEATPTEVKAKDVFTRTVRETGGSGGRHRQGRKRRHSHLPSSDQDLEAIPTWNQPPGEDVVVIGRTKCVILYGAILVGAMANVLMVAMLRFVDFETACGCPKT